MVAARCPSPYSKDRPLAVGAPIAVETCIAAPFGLDVCFFDYGNVELHGNVALPRPFPLKRTLFFPPFAASPFAIGRGRTASCFILLDYLQLQVYTCFDWRISVGRLVRLLDYSTGEKLLKREERMSEKSHKEKTVMQVIIGLAPFTFASRKAFLPSKAITSQRVTFSVRKGSAPPFWEEFIHANRPRRAKFLKLGNWELGV
ncbi:hypothetical protein DFJ73DRAFT_849407 [Zopfochytrium polystomum]|nr:hypothetical protein DFJ73DRAFT_849407 [Zopfochytrium polystomum]